MPIFKSMHPLAMFEGWKNIFSHREWGRLRKDGGEGHCMVGIAHQRLLSPGAGLWVRWVGGNNVVNGQRSSAFVQLLHERHWLTLLSGVHEVFVAMETECLCKIVALVMFVPGEHYINGALQAQSSSAYSSSTGEGWIPRNTVYWAGSSAFLQVCRVEGSMDFSCALDGSYKSVEWEYII